MGGNPGAARIVGKGTRRLMTKGIRMGSFVRVIYREPKEAGKSEKETIVEGKLCDKRVGGQDRESYVELADCMELDAEDRLISVEKKRRVCDAFIELCKVVEKRDPAELEPAPKPVEELAVGNTAVQALNAMPGMMPDMMPTGMQPGSMPGMMTGSGMGAGAMSDMMSGGMQGMMPGMMPGMMQNPMMMRGMMPGGMMMPMMSGMMPMGMGSPMGMMPMGMSPMGMMNMGMMQQGDGMGAVASGSGVSGSRNSKKPSGSTNATSAPTEQPSESRRTGSDSVANVDLGTKILVKYQHPSLGRIRYEGVLVEKQIDGTNHDSFIQLQEDRKSVV